MLRSLNNQVICTPIKEAYAKSVQVGSLSRLSAPSGLAALTVLMSGQVIANNTSLCDYLKVGDTVYVRAEQYTSNWAKGVKQCEDVKDEDGKPVPFIIVPGNEIVFVKVDGDACKVSIPLANPAAKRESCQEP